MVLALLVMSAVPLAGCPRQRRVAWEDIPPAPEAAVAADASPGSISPEEAGAGGASGESGGDAGPLRTRLASRLEERGLRLLGSRLETLPAGVTWAQHQAFRDAHAAGLARTRDWVPEPDAPVLVAEYQAPQRTLFVIARATENRRQLVVLTALAAPR